MQIHADLWIESSWPGELRSNPFCFRVNCPSEFSSVSFSCRVPFRGNICISFYYRIEFGSWSSPGHSPTSNLVAPGTEQILIVQAALDMGSKLSARHWP